MLSSQRVYLRCYNQMVSIQRPKSKQPIPPHAKEVFKGVIFSVHQWEQVVFNGSVQIYEKLSRLDSVTIIPITSDGKIILTHEEQPGMSGFTAVPGGGTMEGEDIEEAAKRELLEETGYSTDNLELWFAFQPSYHMEWAIFVFFARNAKKVSEPELDHGEKIELELVDFDGFTEAVLRDDFRSSEIKQKFLEAKLDPKKMKELKEVFAAQ